MSRLSPPLRRFFMVLLTPAIIWLIACGGSGSGGGSGTTSTGTTGGSGTTSTGTTGGTGTGTSSGSGTGTTGGGTGSSASGPVILVVEENHGFSTVINSSTPPMPFLNSLAQQFGLATQYFADTHPSINNYFEMTAGSDTIAPPPDPDNFPGPVSADNLVRHLTAAGKTWKAYAESLPSVGYIGGDSGAYLHHHNPLSYFTDVINDSAQSKNLVPFDQFSADLNAGALPSFSFVAPNVNDDAHNCPANMPVCLDTDKLKAADDWLQAHINPVLSNPQFKNNGLLLIVFDEAEETDLAHGGGQVALVIIGPKVKTAFRSTTFYQHQDLLRMIAAYIGIDGNIGDAAKASAMTEFFN